MFRLIITLFALTMANAFLAPMPAMTRPTMARQVILSEQEIESIMQSATDCSEGECSLEDVNELIFELKEQQQIMEDRLVKTMNMIAELQNLNKQAEDRDEVKAFVKDMLRVFSHEKPKFPINGFSGDVKDGAKTAWDVLPPKKWSPEN